MTIDSSSTPPAANPLNFVWQLADSAISMVERIAPPVWFQTEAQTRVVLMLNHVLQQEPEAMARLKRQAGKRVVVAWRSFQMDWVATPAGLIDLSSQFDSEEAVDKEPDLRMTLQAQSTADLFRALSQGQTPNARIEGDIQLAAEVGWIAQHVRWDLAEDLSRVIGDAPSQALVQMAQSFRAALTSFVQPPPSV